MCFVYACFCDSTAHSFSSLTDAMANAIGVCCSGTCCCACEGMNMKPKKEQRMTKKEEMHKQTKPIKLRMLMVTNNE
jgi:hypothetical protein